MTNKDLQSRAREFESLLNMTTELIEDEWLEEFCSGVGISWIDLRRLKISDSQTYTHIFKQ